MATREDVARAAAVADRLLPLVEHALPPLSAKHYAEDRRAGGEVGMALERILYVADKNNIDLPIDDLRVVGECLAVPRIAPPAVGVAALQRIVASRVARDGSPQ